MYGIEHMRYLTMNDKPQDYPLDIIAAECENLIKTKGATIYQKFTCANCGSRQTIDEPNTLFTSGICEECKHETDIKKNGCNFLVYYNLKDGAYKS
jgi:hypothetical protein